MISVGLDFSLTASGLARSQAGSYTGELALVGDKGITNLPVVEQMAAIDGLVRQIHAWVLPDHAYPGVVVVEGLDNARTYGGVTERAALWWLAMSHPAMRELMGAGRVYIPTSQQVKIYAAGNGGATKNEIKAAVTRNWPWWAHKGDDNLADAAAMAELGLDLAGQPSTALPKEHTRVLSAIRSATTPPRRVAAKKTAKR